MVTVIPGQKVLASHVNAKLDKDNSDNKPTADFRPAVTNSFDLGSDTLRWKDLYLSGSSIDLGGVKITNNAGVLQWDGNAIIDASGNVDADSLGGKTVGTSADNIVALDGTAKLPAVDGSQLTNLPSTGVSVGLGSVIMHAPSISGADSIATMQGTGFAVCDGTTPASQGISSPTITASTPNLVAQFIRGNATTSGATGGSDTHSHTIPRFSDDSGWSSPKSYWCPTATDDTVTLPPYYELVFMMRVK